METNSHQAPPNYDDETAKSRDEIRQQINKDVMKTIIKILNRNKNIVTEGIDENVDRCIDKLMSSFNPHYLYDGFNNDHALILEKLTHVITFYNNCALRSIGEALDLKRHISCNLR